MARQFTQYPGKETNDLRTLVDGEPATLEAEVTPSAEIGWYRLTERGTRQRVGLPGGDEYSVADRGKTLRIKTATEAIQGTWFVEAPPDAGESEDRAEQQFEVAVRPAAGNDKKTETTTTPDEWDGTWATGVALGALVAALLLAAGIAAAAYAVGIGSTPKSDRVPTIVVLVLLAAGSFALAAAAALAAIAVRGRARAHAAVAEAGRGFPVGATLKSGAELLKAYGSLKEPAALAATALALFGAAVALAWAKFANEEGAKSKGTQAIAVTIKSRHGKCIVATTVDEKTQQTAKAGDAKLSLLDNSGSCGVVLSRGAWSIRSGWRHVGQTRADVKLKPPSYDLTLLQVKGKRPPVRQRPAGILVVAP